MKKNIICGIVMFALAFFILTSEYFQNIEGILSYVPFFIFAFLIPVFYLIFGKKRNPIENFKNY